MTDEKRCRNCAHFVKWVQVDKPYYDSEPDGVCAAPRPLLGPQPNREVKEAHGKNCPMWGETK